MATASKREVGFVVGVETTGGGEIRNLAAEVRKLGAEGDPAAVEFKALADQLDRLGDQADAVTGLRALNAEVDKLAASQVESAAATKAAKDALQAQTATVAQLRERQAAAAAAVAEGVASTRAAGDAVKALRRDYDAAGKATQEYRDKAAAADAAVTAAKNRVDELRVALKTANTAVSQAVAEEGKLATAYLNTRTAAGQADAALRERTVALRGAETAAATLAVSTTDLAQADKQLLDSQGRLIAQLGTLKAQQAERLSLDQQAAAALERTTQTVRALAAAHEQEQAALAESAAAAAASAAAKQRLSTAIERIVAAERAAALAIDLTNQKRQAQGSLDQQAALDALKLGEARRAAVFAAEAELAVLGNSAAATQRYAQAHRDADAAVEAFNDALKRSEQAARAADKAQEQLTASLRETEAAAEKYAAAIGEAAAAGEQDVAATQKRRAAAEALIASERELTAEQRETALARDRSRAALVAEAQALLASARAADESRAATARLVQETLRLGTTVDGGSAAIRRMGAAATEAFGTVGIRGLQQIEVEVRRVDAAMQLLERDFRAGRISADDFARATGAATVKLNQLNAEARQVQALPGQFERINTAIQGVIGKFGAVGAAVATVGVAVRPVIEATVALDQMRRTLTTVTGSADEAERQIDFLRKTSQQAGQSFTEVGASYAKFAASALQSGLSIKQVQDVFKSVSLAAGNLGLSSDQAKRALEALSQIASKGAVSMEELRQQLGDALPGVLPLLAKELRLTQADLNKVVESGNLLAQEAIPAIGRALVALQPTDGVVNGMVATWNRFINVVKQAGTSIVEGPLGQAAGVTLKAFGGVLRDVAVIAVSASEAFKLFGLSTLAVFDALTPGGAKLKDLGKTLDDFAQQAATNIAKFRDTAYGATDGTAKLSEGTRALGVSFAALSIEQQKVIDATEAQVSSSTKYTQAAKDQGEALVTLASLTGSEADAREAAAAAADLMVAATEREEQATARLVETLRAAKVQNEANAVAAGLGAEAVRQKNAEIDKEIIKAEASAEKARQQAEAYRATATAVELAGRAAADNSAKVDTLRKSYDDAKIALENARVAMVSGAGTMADVDKAARALAVAKGLLKDAIDDVSEALERQIKAMQADVKLQEAGIKLEIERQKNEIIAANLAGNTYRVKQATTKILELELQLGNLSTEQKRAEAEATLRAIAIEEDELRMLGQLTPAKAQELESRRKVQLAAVLEAQAANEAAKAKRVEYDELRKGTPAREAHNKATGEGTAATNTNSTATRGNTDAVGANSGALGVNAGQLRNAAGAQDALTQARQRYIQLLLADRGVQGAGGLGNLNADPRYTGVRDAGGLDNLLTANGGKDYSVLGKNDMTPVDNSGMFALIDKYEKGQITAGDYGALQAALAAARNNSYMTAQSSIGSSRLGEYAAIEAKMAAAAQSAMYQQQNAKYNLGGTFGGVKGRTVEVKLNVGGKTVPLETSNANADQLLKLLADAQRSAGGT
jgi:tape measure domain-containing protein